MVEIEGDFYTFLQNAVNFNVEKVEFNVLKDKKIIILGSNLLVKLEKNLRKIFGDQVKEKVFFVGQEKHLDYVQMAFGKMCQKLIWHGNYSLDLVTALDGHVDLDKMDAFVFVSSNPINLRDINILDIAIELRKKGLDIYCFDYGLGQLYKYNNLIIIKNGLQLYSEINEFIDMVFETREE